MPDIAVRQRELWAKTFSRRPDFLGADPSEPGTAALRRFEAESIRNVLELGSGQGRDTLLFAGAGLHVLAFDYAEPGLDQIARRTERGYLKGAVETIVGDVREPLSFADASVDACYAHLLFCMALTTREIERLIREVRRVLRPGGLLVYTVRTTDDAHYGIGIDHGDDRFEMGGFVVHFFDRPLIERLAIGWQLVDTADFEEGRLPRRLAAITLRKPLERSEETG